MYKVVELRNNKVNFIVDGKKARKQALTYLNENYPPNSVVGINAEGQDKPLELWLLEWNYVADPNHSNKYIIGARCAGVADKEEYLLKPIMI